MEDFLKSWESAAILSDERVDYLPTIDDSYASDCENLRVALKFSAMILGNTVEKGIYNSAEVSFALSSELPSFPYGDWVDAIALAYFHESLR
jgi:hypothetical protein